MTEWEPATEAEVAMRDALHANDQELYFRLLSRTDLLLPVSAPTQPGQPPAGWGTWTTGGRTHVLAFTSAAALRACLGEHPGSNRRVPFADLAVGWPNQEWWLAVNPGLPVEGYLPAWFVAQLSRGDVRLPGRAMGARARLERAETLARTRSGSPGRDATPAAGRQSAARASSPGSDATVLAPTPPPPVPPAPVPPAAVPPPPVPPAPVPPRGPARDAQPRVGAPSVPGPASRTPTPAEPSRRPGAEDLPAGQRPPTEPPRPSALPRTGRPSRFAPLTPADHPGADQSRSGAGWPAAARPGDDGPLGGNGGPQAPRRSFFEPSTARDRGPDPSTSGGRPGDRAAPPTRFGRGSQPFPRRRPADAPADETATRAFPMGDPDATRPFRQPVSDLGAPRGVRAPAPAEEVTQPLPPRRPDLLAEEPTRAFRMTGEPPLTRGSERPSPPAEETQAIPRDRPSPYPPVEELSTSAAEPVSGPPAPRRGFTPIVIEGTIIESRDLTAAVETSDPADAAPPPFGSTSSGPSMFAPSSFSPAPPSFTPAQRVPSPSVAGPTVATETTAARVDSPVGGAPSDLGSPSDGVPSTDLPVGGESHTADGDGQRPPADDPAAVDFEPANTVEEDLLGAAGSGSTDTFLSTLLLARVLLPAAPESLRGSRPGDAGFVWRTAQLDGETYVVVYTSPERLADHFEGDVDTVRVKFAQLIRRWPDEDWSFAVNPGTPVGAKLPGEQIVALANWAAEVGLGDDLEVDPEEAPVAAEPTARPRYAPAAVDPTRPTVMQKAIAPSQLAYYLDRGYDRVSGFVHRAGELAHLTTPAQVHDALGLSYPGSPFSRDAEEIYVLRWPAHRPSLYRIPYGGQNEPAMRAMEGWVIERPPFRGNGFAPGESSDVVAEFKVDSARLPHGAQLWRIGVDGTERVVAELDTDTVVWRRVGEA
ncbi:SseB family protein [Micromonospora chokoriensis]|uniref:SseB protein N-terminal domain-containing protein n=1 Tax=Micromonospora chokoriensis TaxID=356851 RepID=A0A1C4UYK9_9ACTN|nr:SseB family protein [Micromonospora chokoriensis]SCE76689.1 SseB protein N-terminal domain-containing protein [Micromonospora chokoriensis]